MQGNSKFFVFCFASSRSYFQMTTDLTKASLMVHSLHIFLNGFLENRRFRVAKIVGTHQVATEVAVRFAQFITSSIIIRPFMILISSLMKVLNWMEV